MEGSEKEAASRTTGTAKAANLRRKGRILRGVMIAVAVVLLITFVRGLLPIGSAPHTDVDPPVVEVPARTSLCPDPQGYWVGNSPVRVRYTPGCEVLRQRSDVGPDLRIWANGDRKTALRWSVTSEPSFGELVVQYVDMELWDSGSDEVYTAFTFPEK